MIRIILKEIDDMGMFNGIYSGSEFGMVEDAVISKKPIKVEFDSIGVKTVRLTRAYREEVVWYIDNGKPSHAKLRVNGIILGD